MNSNRSIIDNSQAQAFLQFRMDLDQLQRVAAEIEEVVVQPHGALQDFAPDPRDLLLRDPFRERSGRCLDGSVLLGRAAEPIRSTLPLGESGNRPARQTPMGS